MKGGARVTAGRPKIPAVIHALRGTHRPDRHGPVEGPAVPSDWQPSEVDLGRLGEAGRELVARVLRDFVLLPIDGLRLLQAAEIADKIACLRAQDRVGMLPAEAAAADRSELGWRQLYARHLDALGVTW